MAWLFPGQAGAGGGPEHNSRAREQAKAKTRAKSSRDSQIGPIDPPLLIVASSSLDC